MSNPRFESDGGGIELDLVDTRAPRCTTCKVEKPPRFLNEQSICQDCHSKAMAVTMSRAATQVTDAELESISVGAITLTGFESIAAESTVNASVQGIGSMAGGQLRSVGFANAEGYIHAIRSGVPARTHAEYITTLRTRYGLTTASLESLKLPGPMAPTALPNGPGIVHKAQGPSVFDRPKSERQFVVGASKSDVTEAPAVVKLEHGQLVAGAVAEGCGVLLGWSGSGRLTLGALTTALEGTGVKPPLAKGARAQAGRVMSNLTGLGYVVRIARDNGHKGTRWTVGIVNHTSSVGASMGENTMTATLSPDGKLVTEGPPSLCTKVQDDFRTLLDEEIYQAGDVTSWIGTVLLCVYDAVRFGVGWYVPAKHADAAGKLCAAVAGTGWGADWILPALPVATSDQLRDGIVRGLTKEVDGLMAQLATERETAKLDKLTRRASAESMTGDAGLRARNAADALSGDIGERRAASFLKELRDIGHRIVAYGQILGEERMDAARGKVRGAVLELETVLGDDYSGIRSRFCAVWDEIERDRKAAGGVL